MAERLKGALLILTGGSRELWGRATGDHASTAHGRLEQLSGHAALACARARGAMRPLETY